MDNDEALLRRSTWYFHKPSMGFYLGIVFALLGIIFMQSSTSLPEGTNEPGPGFLPFLVSSLLLGVILVVLTREIISRGPRSTPASVKGTGKAWRSIAFIAIILTYYVVLPLISFLGATLLLMAVLFRLFGVQSYIVSIVAAVLTTGLVYFTFVELFRIPLYSL